MSWRILLSVSAFVWPDYSVVVFCPSPVLHSEVMYSCVQYCILKYSTVHDCTGVTNTLLQ